MCDRRRGFIFLPVEVEAESPYFRQFRENRRNHAVEIAMSTDVEFIGSFVVNQVENDLPEFRLNAPRRIAVSEETDLSVTPSLASEGYYVCSNYYAYSNIRL